MLTQQAAFQRQTAVYVRKNAGFTSWRAGSRWAFEPPSAALCMQWAAVRVSMQCKASANTTAAC